MLHASTAPIEYDGLRALQTPEPTATHAPPPGEPFEGKTFDTGAPATSVRSVNAVIPALGWRLLVELPTAETQATLWCAVIGVIGLLGLGLLAALFAIRTAVCPFTPVQPARA